MGRPGDDDRFRGCVLPVSRSEPISRRFAIFVFILYFRGVEAIQKTRANPHKIVILGVMTLPFLYLQR